jgi:putative ABC transport system permease protein
MRAFTNVLGYTLAIIISVGLISRLKASQKASAGILQGVGTHFIVFEPACNPICGYQLVDPVHEGFTVNGTPTRPLPTNLISKISQLSSIRNASPFIAFHIRDPHSGAVWTIGGIEPGSGSAIANNCCSSTDIVSGHFLTPEDTGKVMLDAPFARYMNWHPGKILSLAGLRFTVIGIINAGVRPAKADIYMNIMDARKVITRRILKGPISDLTNVALIEVKSSTQQLLAIQSVKNLDANLLSSTYACYKPASKVMGMEQSTLLLIASTLFLAAGLFALKSQMASVSERQHELGILSAIGWSQGDIIQIILAESIIQALMGCIAGVILCLLSNFFLRNSSFGNGFYPPVLFGGILIVLSCGVFAGLIPAIVAAGRRPSQSLRQL